MYASYSYSQFTGYSSLQNKSSSDEVSKKNGIERLDILNRIAELQSQIDQVEKDVQHPEKEILQTGDLRGNLFLLTYELLK